MRRLTIFLFLLISAVGLGAKAFIPSGLLILQKTAENGGNGIYQIEQEVQFPMVGMDHFALKETWLVENENTLRLWVTGTKEYKDLIRMNFLYVGGQRLELIGGKRITNKVSEDFLEKFLHFRNSEFFANALIQLNIAPQSLLAKKPFRGIKDFEYQPESFIRLSRVGGVINYAFGAPAPSDSSSDLSQSTPGIWIEQDQFVVRKLKLPSQAEMTAERHSQYPRGLMYPRKRTVLWDNNSVQLQTLSVVAKPRQPNLFSATTLEPTKTEALDGLPNRKLIEDFYKRFR